MGPSGAGKDSLIDKALEANLPGLWIAPRLITRRNPEKTTDIYLEREGFAELEARGRLALSWASHGHLYGILDSLETALDKGLTVIVNGSRDYLSHARLRYPNLVPVLVTAHPNVLKARLEKRAREDPESIAERLSRTNDSFALPLAETITIDNSESLETASEAFITLLKGYLPN
jgi:ribose 1,5-bisphosphokinase